MKLKVTFPPRRDGSFGRVGTQAIDADGTVEIADEDEAARLIATGNFEPYTFKSVDDSLPKPPADAPVTMIITNGDETVDLMTLDKERLLWMAREEMELDVSGRNSEATLREAIYAHVTKQ